MKDDYRALAITSIALSILSIVWLAVVFTPLSIVCGVIARQSHNETTKNLATAGVVIGILEFITLLILLILLI